jgi:hypothetical protein
MKRASTLARRRITGVGEFDATRVTSGAGSCPSTTPRYPVAIPRNSAAWSGSYNPGTVGSVVAGHSPQPSGTVRAARGPHVRSASI